MITSMDAILTKSARGGRVRSGSLVKLGPKLRGTDSMRGRLR